MRAQGSSRGSSGDADRPTVEVILPCLDEAAVIGAVVSAVPDGWAVLVVDNGSVDGSPRIAADHGARVITEVRRGYGAACHAGLLAAVHDIVVVMDADGSLDPAQLPQVVAPVLHGEADL